MSVIYLNGNYVDDKQTLISYLDCGFTTGIGVFDSMLGRDGSLINSAEHYERLIHDAKSVIGLKLNLSFDGFEKICAALIEKNNLQNGYVRIRTTVTGGNVKVPLAPAHTPTIIIDIAATKSGDNLPPVTCAIISDFPRIAGCGFENCKRLDYSRSYAARRKAESLGAEEAIITNTDGNIACGATSNLFIKENGALITPPLTDGILSGITRRKLIEEHEVKQESISPERLKAANKIYLTNSFIGLRPVTLLN